MKNIILALILLSTACGGGSTIVDMDGGVPDSDVDGNVDVDGDVDAGPDADVVDYDTCMNTETDTGFHEFTVTNINGQGQGRDLNNVLPSLQSQCDFEDADGLDNGWEHFVNYAGASYPYNMGDSDYYPLDIDHLMQDSVNSLGNGIKFTVSRMNDTRNDDCLGIDMMVGNVTYASVGRMVDGALEQMTAFTIVGVDVDSVPFRFKASSDWIAAHPEVCTVERPCATAPLDVNLHDVRVSLTISQDNTDITAGEITGFVPTVTNSNEDLAASLRSFMVNLNVNNTLTNVEQAGHRALRYTGDLFYNGGTITQGACYGFVPRSATETNGTALSVAWTINTL